MIAKPDPRIAEAWKATADNRRHTIPRCKIASTRCRRRRTLRGTSKQPGRRRSQEENQSTNSSPATPYVATRRPIGQTQVGDLRLIDCSAFFRAAFLPCVAGGLLFDLFFRVDVAGDMLFEKLWALTVCDDGSPFCAAPPPVLPEKIGKVGRAPCALSVHCTYLPHSSRCSWSRLVLWTWSV